jgi:hypothetical protein
MAVVDCIWNVIADAQKPEFVFRRNGRVHLNRRGHQFNQLLAAEVCASVVNWNKTMTVECKVLIKFSYTQYCNGRAIVIKPFVESGWQIYIWDVDMICTALQSCIHLKVKGKVHPCTGRTAHRGSRGIALLRLCRGRTAHRGVEV